MAISNYEYEEEEQEVLEIEGFVSEDGKHYVEWMLAEIAPKLEYETWWCMTHDRLYYGGCA